MALASELASFYDSMRRSAPGPVLDALDAAARDHQATFNRDTAIGVGQELPDFNFLDETGMSWSKEKLLAKGPMLISFQRGGWCPFCNIELRALQKSAPQFREQGVTLVTISPDQAHESLERKESMQLEFLMLSDVENELATKLGIVNRQPETLRPVLTSMNKGFEDSRKSLNVPIPATILVDREGIVRQSSINPAYHQRLEPATALKWIEALNKTAAPLRGKGITQSEVRELGRSGSRYGWPV